MRNLNKLLLLAIALIAASTAQADVTYTDSFSTAVNYLSNGIAGTMWDGVYLGAGEFNNTGVGGGGPGSTIQCDAGITSPNTLTLQTTGTAWEGSDDDGFFLFKVVPGDFSMSVHVVTPFNNAGYNTAGLQARAFGNGGDAFGGQENFVSWTRFDEFGFPNYLRSELNGGVAQINPGGYPNGSYWLRMDRVRGTNFLFYQRTNNVSAWQIVNTFPAPVIGGTNMRRSDLLNLPLQVGIIHATFAGQLGVQFTDFSLIESNVTFATPPAAPSNLTLTTNFSGTLAIGWTPGSGSAGSLVAVWTGTNSILKQAPANGFVYTGNASYGQGSTMPAENYYVVYVGNGSSVIVSNLQPGTVYNAVVFSYSGSGATTAYNRTPARGKVSIPLNQIVAQVNLQTGDVLVSSKANPGKWYWLQSSDSLNPPMWQNVLPGPIFANSSQISLADVGGALASQRFYRLQQVDPLFTAHNNSGFITSLQRTGDAFPTEYISGGGQLGDSLLKYRPVPSSTWQASRTSTGTGIASSTNYVTPDGTQYISRYIINNGLAGNLIYELVFTWRQDSLLWNLNLTNLTSQTVELGDLALPLPMNSAYSGVTSSAMKHSFISCYDSFLFWMRPNSVGPCLLLTPDDNTKLEYWDRLNGYEVYIHSTAASAQAATIYPAVTTQGARWRQTNTSLTLSPGASQRYGFKFQWADDYEDIRQRLTEEGKLDVHIVPGMTVPTNLFALIALNTTQQITSVTAEFPSSTQVQYLGVTNATQQLYRVQFSQLGENELTVRYGNGMYMYLEFFVTEPVETLIKKRASFLVSKQINDASKWYLGLYCDWNMNDQVLVTPDNHDTLGNSFQVYEIASDDAGESRPSYMAEKEAAFPIQSEVNSLDNYIRYFVWNTGLPTGGLQRTTNETFAYAIYGVPDWHNLRTNNSLSIGRGYDYPHIIDMYYGMYRVAKYHPEVTTFLSAQEYLTRAYGTAIAMFNYGGGQATQIGLMNELVISDVIDALQAEGMNLQAATLRTNWEQKVSYYVNGYANLFGSEYAFDSTGFESQQAYAKYAMLHAGSSALMGSSNPAAFRSQVRAFMDTQMAANVFDRGWLETTYYHYGSDFRGDMGDDYVLSYMAQMGGWGILDYALYWATNSTDYLRLGYASILSAWATMNSGTPASNYGFWYPGLANDGGCGGGFEPLPYNTTWLGGQQMHRGNWYYSAEENLGFCGALRAAACILADDSIFGRVCYGGVYQSNGTTNQVTPMDGVRRRFHAMLGSSNLHLTLNADRFTDTQPILMKDDLTFTEFQIESGNPNAHTEILRLTVSISGQYTLSNNHGLVINLNLVAGQEATVNLPVDAAATAQPFFLTR